MSDRRCETCAYYAPGQQWCMEWGRNVGPRDSCARWYPEHGEAVSTVTKAQRIRIAPRHAGNATLYIHPDRLYVSMRALRAIGSPKRIAIDVEPSTRMLVITPDDGPDTWAVHGGGVGTKGLVEQLAKHGWGIGRYVCEVNGNEIRVRRDG